MFTHVPDSVKPQMRTLQMLSGALIAGVIAFAVIAHLIAGGRGPTQGAGAPPIETLRIICFTMLGANVLFAWMARLMFTRSAARGVEPTIDNIFPRYFVTTILAMALLEGAALFSCVLYLMAGEPIDLLPALIAVLVMAGLFLPLEGRFIHLAEQARQSAEIGS